MELLAGIDIGGTKTAIAVADPCGKILGQRKIETSAAGDPQAFLRRIAEEVKHALAPFGGRLISAGVGCCGPLDLERGLVLSPPNMPSWKHVELVSELTESLGAPVVLENDANAAALGEHAMGAARGFEDALYVTVSTGIGGAVIVGGKLIHGIGGGAGEIGHMNVCPDGPACGCGQRGCLEAVSSGSAMARRARHLLKEDASSQLKDYGDALTAREIVACVASGDKVATSVWNDAMHYLALGLANAIVVLAPAVVVIGGGIAMTGDLLFRPLREELHRRVSILPVKQIEIRRAMLGSESALYGAVALARENAGRIGAIAAAV